MRAGRLICSGGAWRFVRTNSLRLEQLIHDVRNNSIFALLLEVLTIWNVNADPVLDLGARKTHVRKLANNTSTANLDGRRRVGGSGGITAMTRTTNRTTADGVVTTWDADHFKGRELASALADDERAVLCLWADGGVNIRVHRGNIGGGFGNISIRCVGPLPFHSFGLFFGPVHRFLSLVFGFRGKKPRLPLLR